MRLVVAVCAALIAYAQVGYALVLALLARVLEPSPAPAPEEGSSPEPPRVAVIIAAHDEAAVIEAKVRNALALDWPRDRLEIVVASDGSTDATAARARAAGADRVLELPWAGKVRAQDAAVDATDAELLAFGDANALWEPDALERLMAAFADPAVGYACGQVRFMGGSGTNQEGLYWRYELWLRARESRLHAVTAGNGAIYAVRRGAYLRVDPVMGHDLSLPFNLVKRGWRAVYVPEARATEKMVPTIEGEWARKRRMMAHAWPIVLRGGMLSPRGYPPRYAFMILSHRVLRYATPLLHVVLLAAGVARRPAGRSGRALLAAQLLLLAAAAAGGAVRARPLLVARYYVLTQASIAFGLWDWARHGTPRGVAAAGGDAVRRAFDVAVAAVGLALASPLLAAAAVAIRLESPGHVLYRQRRIGRDGKPFDVLKLRTMVSGAETMGSGLAVDAGDPRITRVGAFLRRTSLDEVPNLLNVLRGDMAIVGPRPTVPVQVERYTARQRRRLAVKPGITGWAQVNGRATLPWYERIELDLWYVQHRSWVLDLRIIARTARLVVLGDGLYKGETGGWKA